MHSFSEDVSVDLSTPAATGHLIGDFELSADLVALQLRARL